MPTRDYISDRERDRIYALGPGLFTDPSGQVIETHRGEMRVSRLQSVYDFEPDMLEVRGIFECNSVPPSATRNPPPAMGTLASSIAGQFAAYALPECVPITFASAYISQWQRTWPNGVVHCEFRAFPVLADGQMTVFRIGQQVPHLERMFRRVQVVISSRAIEVLCARQVERLINEHMLLADFDLNADYHMVEDRENRRLVLRQVRPVFTPAPDAGLAEMNPVHRLEHMQEQERRVAEPPFIVWPKTPPPEPAQPVDLAALKKSLIDELFAGDNDGPKHIARIDGEGGFRMVPSEN